MALPTEQAETIYVDVCLNGPECVCVGAASQVLIMELADTEDDDARDTEV